MYEVRYTSKARKDLKKLSKNLSDTVIKKVNELKPNPFSHVSRLHGKKKLWRLRVQDYRAILDIIISGRKIIILRVGHRKNIYDKI